MFCSFFGSPFILISYIKRIISLSSKHCSSVFHVLFDFADGVRRVKTVVSHTCDAVIVNYCRANDEHMEQLMRMELKAKVDA